MTRWISRGVALAIIALVAYLVWQSTPARAPVVTHDDAGADAAAPLARADAGPSTAPEAGLFLSDLPDIADMLDAGPSEGGAMALSGNAPRQVRLGVVLVTFHGAQGAPANARPKQDAREIADRLAAEAKTDFHGAVQHGDTGSSDDIGRMPRGVLEPAIEYAVFSLAPGGVSDVIETPRGFWIVKRTD